MSRRRRTSSRSSRKTYTVTYLLSRQPKSLRKHPDYPAMIGHYRSSPALRQVRFSRRCYTLLNHARIADENLVYFYRTYRLPRDPFWPLFFKIKREYLAERELLKSERRRYILDALRSLPPTTLGTIKYLGYLERYYNGAGRSPIWQQHLFPSSKRRADEYRRFGTVDWITIFRRHLERLRDRYGVPTEVAGERVLAAFVLGLVPQEIPPRRPEAALVNKCYRRLSLLHHPDQGGDPVEFIEVQRARDTLVRK
ncbi:MAG: hypothetical protein ACLFNP_09245 [Spirochaetaceae bacterium]